MYRYMYIRIFIFISVFIFIYLYIYIEAVFREPGTHQRRTGNDRSNLFWMKF